MAKDAKICFSDTLWSNKIVEFRSQVCYCSLKVV